MSYVVKNCPAYDYEEEFDYHICKQPLVPYEGNVDDCQKCTDCVIKRVIEVCKKEVVINYPKREKEFITVNGYQAILNMFDIEEINK